jgi:alkaline phosphatase
VRFTNALSSRSSCYSFPFSRLLSRVPAATLALLIVAPALAPAMASAATRIRIMPPDRATFAVGQRFDLRVEATADGGPAATPPSGLTVTINGEDITPRNILDAGAGGGERGLGGVGATGGTLQATWKATAAPTFTTNFLLRDYAFEKAGSYVIAAKTADGATAQVTVTASVWDPSGLVKPATAAASRQRGNTRRGDTPARGNASMARAKNIIFLLGDGMGMAHRTAARIISRGVADGKPKSLLAMDTLEVTGQVMTFALNSAITDSAPGMSSYSTGVDANNNQEGVFPDNTPDPFDNPRVEYIGEMLKRVRGAGFNVGIVTTADVTDATPGANAVHTADRNAGPRIADRFFDERARNGVTVLLGGGRRNFLPHGTSGSVRREGDKRALIDEYKADGYQYLQTGSDVASLLKAPGAPPAKLLGLFHPQHLAVAFDRVGAGKYSDELSLPKNAALKDQPALDDLAALALRSLSASSPNGFYLLLEGASIDKQAHASDAERMVWDTIEFDNAVKVALDFADKTNNDSDPTNDTLVIVTADHETGGLGIIAVGNERFAPVPFGESVRDYAAVFRFAPVQMLNFHPNYEVDARGFPVNPDPSRKLLFGWSAGPDRFENWLSNRRMLDSSVRVIPETAADATGARRTSVANMQRDGMLPGSDNKSVDGQSRPGFLVSGTIENGAYGCAGTTECPGDTSSDPHIISGHTGSDVPLSATGPGAIQFTGTYDNTDVFVKMLRATTGSYDTQPRRR